MGALVSSFYIDNVFNKVAYCGLRRWCHVASSLQRAIPGLEVIVFSNNETIVPKRRRGRLIRQDLSGVVATECPHARHINFAAELLDAVARWDRRGCAEEDTACRGVSSPLAAARWMLKWSAVDPRHYSSSYPPVVLLLDPDVDATWQAPATVLGPGGRHDVQRLAHAFMNDVSCQLSGMPDHSSPINGGVLLLKPNRTVYEEGLKLLRTRSFSTTTGFNGSGSLQRALNATVMSPTLSAAFRQRVARTVAYHTDTWGFVNGDSDQGLFTAMYMARGRFCAPRHRRPYVQHFMAREKPWHDPPSCERYFDFLTSDGAQPSVAIRVKTRETERHTGTSLAHALDGPQVGVAPNTSRDAALRASPCSRYLLWKAAKMSHNRTRCRGVPWPVF